MSDVKLKAVHQILDSIRKSLEHVESMVADIEHGKTELSDADLERLEMTSSIGAHLVRDLAL